MIVISEQPEKPKILFAESGSKEEGLELATRLLEYLLGRHATRSPLLTREVASGHLSEE